VKLGKEKERVEIFWTDKCLSQWDDVCVRGVSILGSSLPACRQGNVFVIIYLSCRCQLEDLDGGFSRVERDLQKWRGVNVDKDTSVTASPTYLL